MFEEQEMTTDRAHHVMMQEKIGIDEISVSSPELLEKLYNTTLEAGQHLSKEVKELSDMLMSLSDSQLTDAHSFPPYGKDFEYVEKFGDDVDKVADKIIQRINESGIQFSNTSFTRCLVNADLNDFDFELLTGFITALSMKLRKAELKYGFTNDWVKPDWEKECKENLRLHLIKGDPIDVAIYAAFMWFHGWKTNESI